MNLKARLLALALFLAAPASLPASAAAQTAAARAPSPAETYTLPNGLRVVLDEDHRAPFVGVALRLATGHKDDPPGRAGLAELLGRLMKDASTRHLDRGDQAALFRSLGVEPFWPEVQAFADTTGVELTVPARDLPLALWIESDRLGFFADGIHEDLIASERHDMQEEAVRKQGEPYGEITHRTIEALFGPGHRYAHAYERSPAELTTVTPAELRAQIDRFYGPDNVVLALSGDLQPAAARELVARYFGPLAARPHPADSPPPKPALSTERKLAMEAGVGRPLLMLAWPTTRYLDEADLVLDLVAQVLLPRLSRRLIRELHLADNVQTWQQSLRFGSAFLVQVLLAEGHSSDEAIRAVDQEIDRLRDALVPAAELTVGQDRMELRGLRDQDNPGDRASSLGAFALAAGDPFHLGTVIAFRRSVDGERLRATVRDELPAGRRLVTLVTPTPDAPRAGRLGGGG